MNKNRNRKNDFSAKTTMFGFLRTFIYASVSCLRVVPTPAATEIGPVEGPYCMLLCDIANALSKI